MELRVPELVHRTGFAEYAESVGVVEESQQPSRDVPLRTQYGNGHQVLPARLIEPEHESGHESGREPNHQPNQESDLEPDPHLGIKPVHEPEPDHEPKHKAEHEPEPEPEPESDDKSEYDLVDHEGEYGPTASPNTSPARMLVQVVSLRASRRVRPWSRRSA
jgi:hypothetical protein